MSRLKDLSRVGEFMIQGKLGEGGFGLVMKATSLKTGAQVALKLIDMKTVVKASHVQGMLREASVLKSLHHQHILTYIQQLEVDNVFCLVTGTHACPLCGLPRGRYARVPFLWSAS